MSTTRNVKVVAAGRLEKREGRVGNSSVKAVGWDSPYVRWGMAGGAK